MRPAGTHAAGGFTCSAPSSVWYAGMVVDPTDFSEQLCHLQTSLKGTRITLPDGVQSSQSDIRQ